MIEISRLSPHSSSSLTEFHNLQESLTHAVIFLPTKDTQLCQLVVCQLDTSQSHLGKEIHNSENSLVRLAFGKLIDYCLDVRGDNSPHCEKRHLWAGSPELAEQGRVASSSPRTLALVSLTGGV